MEMIYVQFNAKQFDSQQVNTSIMIEDSNTLTHNLTSKIVCYFDQRLY